ncbi:hypothetical protein PVL29_021889 [Vitis rotundifolia]|uniref:DUF3444 domain-containing protein n=1 Tax=Vitis rotundifolia TaxID=103349 RepID=A0AA38YU13_VITRO|nr:hypothetical protein PVL29_021889 [Vitis rotundifolia]
MPRCYAIVHSVESLEPFRIRISWLNTKSRSTEMASVNWVCSGFMKTSGDFQVGKLVDYDSLISFSHRVKWTKVGGGAIRIYPRKGEVWAVYRDWSPDWNELTPDEVIQKYDVVEVIMEDYEWHHRHGGVAVIPLVKVSGFKAVFHRHLDPNAVRMIPREELFRFSHQVPSVVLTGREAENAPSGCRELDPAATPLELLEVITISEEEASIRTAELD